MDSVMLQKSLIYFARWNFGISEYCHKSEQSEPKQIWRTCAPF